MVLVSSRASLITISLIKPSIPILLAYIVKPSTGFMNSPDETIFDAISVRTLKTSSLISTNAKGWINKLISRCSMSAKVLILTIGVHISQVLIPAALAIISSPSIVMRFNE